MQTLAAVIMPVGALASGYSSYCYDKNAGWKSRACAGAIGAITSVGYLYAAIQMAKKGASVKQFFVRYAALLAAGQIARIAVTYKPSPIVNIYNSTIHPGLMSVEAPLVLLGYSGHWAIDGVFAFLGIDLD